MAVACDKAEFLDDQTDTLLNPMVIIEVLSPSTESVDRTAKFEAYREMPSLQHYVLVDSRAIVVDHYQRAGEAAWLLSNLRQPQDRLEFATIGAGVTLSQVYERVQLATADDRSGG